MGKDELVTRAHYTCTRCGVVVEVCTICRLSFLPDQVVLCRLANGHDHATCATAKIRTVAERTPSSPPPSGERKR